MVEADITRPVSPPHLMFTYTPVFLQRPHPRHSIQASPSSQDTAKILVLSAIQTVCIGAACLVPLSQEVLECQGLSIQEAPAERELSGQSPPRNTLGPHSTHFLRKSPAGSSPHAFNSFFPSPSFYPTTLCLLGLPPKETPVLWRRPTQSALVPSRAEQGRRRLEGLKDTQERSW